MFRRRGLRLSRDALFFITLTLLIFAVIRLLVILERNLGPTILAVAAMRADILAAEAINQAVSEKVASGILYQDLVMLNKGGDGRIILAQINSMEVNRLLAETTLRVQQALVALKREVIYIPLGQAFGSYPLADYGPLIPITLVPMGRVNTEVIDTFEEAGINQVRHKIYFNIHAEVQVVIPFVSAVTQVSTTVPIVDAIYPGEVPDTVINLQFPGGFSQQMPPPGQ